MRYPTNQLTNRRTQPVIEVLCRTMRLAPNKAEYTAALVADGWAVAENLGKQLSDGTTDRRTKGPKDRKVTY